MAHSGESTGGLEVIYTVLEVLIGVACCLGNVLVIWAVWICGAPRQPTFCFVVSLAAADFLVGAVVVPLAVLVDGRVNTSFHSCLFISCLVITLTQASVLSLLAIAVDRFLRVNIPLRYKRTVTERRSWAVVVACWLTACALGFIPMIGWSTRHTSTLSSSNGTIVCAFVAVIPMSYMVYFSFFVCLLTPLAIMVALYAYIFWSIRRQLRFGPVSGSESPSYLRKERSLAHSLALVLALFVASWLPLHFMNTVAFYGHLSDVPVSVFYVGILLSHANSAVNPVVYALKIRKIKAAYQTILTRYVLCREDQKTAQSSQDMENNSSNNPNSTARNDQVKVSVYTSSDGQCRV